MNLFFGRYLGPPRLGLIIPDCELNFDLFSITFAAQGIDCELILLD